MMNITGKLAEFIVNLDYQTIPEEVREHAKVCFLDSLGCGLFGSTTQWGKILQDFAVKRGGYQEATAWGTNKKIPLEMAALVNGTCTHGFEMDDLHPGSILHPGAVTLPVILALAEVKGNISGKEAITALVAGYEVGARIGLAVGAQQLRRGYHPTATLGTFAAAAAAAKLLKLDQEQTIHALGIAGSQGAGLMAAQFSSMVKRMHAGAVAEIGLRAAMLAECGFTGITNVVEAEYGGFCTTHAEHPVWEPITAELGQRFEVMHTGFKPYCCCGSNHTSLDAIQELMSRHDADKQKIAQVRIYTTKATKLHVGWPYRPESVTTAQMNLYYCVGALLEDGKIFVEQFAENRLSDPNIMKWIEKIEVIHDPQLDEAGDKGRHAVRVELEMADGALHTTTVKHAWGSSSHPMTLEEVQNKFRILAETVLEKAKVSQLMETILALQACDDVGEVCKYWIKEG